MIDWNVRVLYRYVVEAFWCRSMDLGLLVDWMHEFMIAASISSA